MGKKERVVLTGGVFDIIHIGHLYTLEQAKKYGDRLVVVVASDKHIIKKGRRPIHTQKYRAKIVSALKPVDRVVLGGNDPAKVLSKIKPDVIVYGYDQEPFLKPKGARIVKLKKRVDEKQFKTNKIIRKLGF